MTTTEFKNKYKKVINIDSVQENQNNNLLIILTYIFNELKDCNFTISKINSIDSITIQSNNCKDKLQALNDKYVKTYQSYGLKWTNSGDYTIISVNPINKNTTSTSSSSNKSTTPNWIKDNIKQAIQPFLKTTNLSENLINDINRIKKLL